MPPMKRPANPQRSIFTGTVSIHSAARRLEMSPKAFRRMMGTGQIEFVQIRGEIRVPRRELTRLLDMDEPEKD